MRNSVINCNNVITYQQFALSDSCAGNNNFKIIANRLLRPEGAKLLELSPFEKRPLTLPSLVFYHPLKPAILPAMMRRDWRVQKLFFSFQLKNIGINSNSFEITSWFDIKFVLKISSTGT